MEAKRYQEAIVEPAMRLVEELNIQDGLCPVCGKEIWKGHVLQKEAVRMCREYHQCH